MTVYGMLQLYIRSKGAGLFKSATVLTAQDLDRLAATSPLPVHDDPNRADPIYDEEFEPVAYRGSVPVDVDLTVDLTTSDNEGYNPPAHEEINKRQSKHRRNQNQSAAAAAAAASAAADSDNDDDDDDDDYEFIKVGHDRHGKPKFKRVLRGRRGRGGSGFKPQKISQAQKPSNHPDSSDDDPEFEQRLADLLKQQQQSKKK